MLNAVLFLPFGRAWHDDWISLWDLFSGWDQVMRMDIAGGEIYL
jgi:hypothetical protein